MLCWIDKKILDCYSLLTTNKYVRGLNEKNYIDDVLSDDNGLQSKK